MRDETRAGMDATAQDPMSQRISIAGPLAVMDRIGAIRGVRVRVAVQRGMRHATSTGTGHCRDENPPTMPCAPTNATLPIRQALAKRCRVSSKFPRQGLFGFVGSRLTPENGRRPPGPSPTGCLVPAGRQGRTGQGKAGNQASESFLGPDSRCDANATIRRDGKNWEG